MVHSELIFCRFNVDVCPKIVCNFCIKVPIYVMQENFHLCCTGSIKVQEWSFFYLSTVLPENFFLMDAKGAFLAKFLSNSC